MLRKSIHPDYHLNECDSGPEPNGEPEVEPENGAPVEGDAEPEDGELTNCLGDLCDSNTTSTLRECEEGESPEDEVSI